MLNPLIRGWRGYYRYATNASRDFTGLDWWMTQRVGRWLRKKHPKATWHELYRRFSRSPRGTRLRWGEGSAKLGSFFEGGVSRYPNRGIHIPNGWNDEPGECFLRGADQFWSSFYTLAER